MKIRGLVFCFLLIAGIAAGQVVVVPDVAQDPAFTFHFSPEKSFVPDAQHTIWTIEDLDATRKCLQKNRESRLCTTIVARHSGLAFDYIFPGNGTFVIEVAATDTHNGPGTAIQITRKYVVTVQDRVVVKPENASP